MDAAASGGLARWAKRSQRTAKSCGPGAATVASILREDIPQTTVTINAAHRGEHEVSRKAIARGKAGCLGCTCSPCPCASHMGCPCAPAHGIYGRSQRPAFPAPSHHERDDEIAKLGRIVSREYLRLSFRDERSESPESITAIVSTDFGLAPSGAPRNDEGAV